MLKGRQDDSHLKSQVEVDKVSSSKRRVWVRSINGKPTSIMISKHDLIDDLKSAICRKYEQTIAKGHDSSEIRLSILTHGRDQSLKLKTLRSEVSVNRVKSESSEFPNSKISMGGKIHEMNLILLQSDKNVWDTVSEYFGREMTMHDAFIIDVADDLFLPATPQLRFGGQRPEGAYLEQLIDWGSPGQVSGPKVSSLTANIHIPKPQKPHPTSNKLMTADNRPDYPLILNEASQTKKTNGSLKPSSAKSLPTLNLQNKPTKSQAVLLLPKNFSLHEQNSLKRVTMDQDLKLISKLKIESDLINNTDTVSDKNNRNEIGADLASSEYETPVSRSDTPKNRMVSTADKYGSNEGSKDKARKTNPTKAGGSLSASRDRIEKTLNTSTFEQVLPSISVLVVEDNSINQAILGAFLRKHKIHYQIAKNGQEAVDKWRKGGFHLVLMDIQLPVKSGIEATKEIRFLEKVNKIGVFAQHELSSGKATSQSKMKDDQKLDLNVFRSPVIIVALTASSNSSVDKKNALTAGCNDFLTKPVNLVWLQNKITEWGCMQALIDFDGWRGKGNSSASSSKSVSSI